MKTLITATIIFALLSSLVVGIQAVEDQSYQTITIKPDGSVEPDTNLLERNGTKYTFKGDIFGTIMVQKGSITIDGAGHTLQGRGIHNETGINLAGPDLSHRHCRYVLVKNLRICNSSIYSVGGSNNSFIGNYLDKTGILIRSSDNYIGNLIKHNTFRDATIFVDYNRYGLDVITENNFFNSGVYYGLSEAPIVDKNYWSNYNAKYPDAKELDSSGIWDTPHVDDNFESVFSGIDYHPLVNPITDFEIPDFSNLNSTPTPEPEPFPTTIAVASIAIITVIGVGILVYFKKYRK